MTDLETARDEFSVALFFADGTHAYDLRWVDAKSAVDRVEQLSRSVGARIGNTTRIIITDGGDFTVFEWVYGKGVTWPTPSQVSGEHH